MKRFTIEPIGLDSQPCDPLTVTLDELLVDENAQDPELVEQANSVPVDASFIIGGGAAAAYRITRIDNGITWVSAYDTNRAYGGPEEGGWWFDTGVLLASIPCTTDEQIEEAKARLHALYDAQFEGNHEIGSVLCEGQLSIQTSDEQGADYPQDTPHYE